MVNSVFKCIRCTGCCFFKNYEDAPVVYPWEKRVLEQYAKIRGVSVVFKPFLVYRSSCRAVVVLYKWVINGYCPFYDKSRRSCTIYRDRPFACKMYPLILGLRDNTLRLSTACRWVQEVLGETPASIDPSKVFPYEYSIAIKNFVKLKYLSEMLKSMGFTEEVVSREEHLSEAVDVDNYVDIDVEFSNG